MSPLLILASLVFLVLFALIVFAIRVTTGVAESQKKKKVTEMLEGSAGSMAQAQSRVLIEKENPANEALVKFLSQFNFVRTLEKQILQGGMTTPVFVILGACLALGFIGVLVGLRVNFLLKPLASMVAGGVIGGFLPILFVRRKRTKRLALIEEQFPEALDFLGRAMRAGHAFSIALEMYSEEGPQPLAQEFRKVFNEQNLGLPIETALENLSNRAPLVDVSFFVSAVLLQRETGGNLAEILGKLAAVIRERFKLKGAVRAASGHGRITGSILTLMPVVLTFGLLLVAPGYLQGMAADEDGKYLIMGAVIGLLLGHFTIRRIVDIKV